MSKSEAGEFLPDALQAILGGETYATPEMQVKLAKAKPQAPSPEQKHRGKNDQRRDRETETIIRKGADSGHE